MMKKFGVLVAALLIAASAQADFTVATFANPSTGSWAPLFNVDWAADTVTGGWADGLGGLSLEFTYSAVTLNDVWFEMAPVAITSEPIAGEYGYTGGGVINFYAAGTVVNPVLTITFESGVVNKFVFGSDNATFTGSEITIPLDEEQFSFAFAAKRPTNGGFSATAAFDASAIPEPATLSILGLGSLVLVRRKRA